METTIHTDFDSGQLHLGLVLGRKGRSDKRELGTVLFMLVDHGCNFTDGDT